MTRLFTTPFDPRTTAEEIIAGVDLAGKRMIVTGGASGLGAETVRALAKAGADVTVAVRNRDAAAALIRTANDEGWAGQVCAAQLDLADLDSVRAFAKGWTGPLHALIANAGVMALPELTLSAAGWEMQLATNYLGHFTLALSLDDALREAGNARVVVVSSGAHRGHAIDLADLNFEHTPYDRWVAYGRSKSASVLLAVGIAKRWASDGITANALMPGWITTNLQRHIDLPTLQAMGAADEQGNRIDAPYFKTSAQGAATSVLLAASPLVEGVTGTYFEDNQEAPVTVDGTGNGVAAHAIDPDTADSLWDYTVDFLSSVR